MKVKKVAAQKNLHADAAPLTSAHGNKKSNNELKLTETEIQNRKK
jgi:hypothetical protein